MKRLSSLLLLLFVASACAYAQAVPMVKYDDFEKRINTASPDTVVIYNFWATWCKPCVEEIPDFDKFGAEYSSKKVKLVFVSLDFKSQLKKVEAFVTKKQLKAEVILLDAPDYNKWLDRVNPQWGGSIPATLLIVGPKAERKFHEGPLTYEELQKFITPLLKP